MSFNPVLLRASAAAVLLAAAGAAHADSAAASTTITFYTSQSAYQAALTNTATDNFADLAPLVGQDVSTPLNRSVGSYGYGLSAYNYAQYAGPDTVYVVGPASQPQISTTLNFDILIADGFTGGANAFGANFYGLDAGNNFVAGTTLSIEVLDSNGTDTSMNITPTDTGGSSFLGIISTGTITTINATVFNAPDNTDVPYVVMDNVILGQTAAAVPEPGSYALLLAGLGLLGAVARRRRA